MGKRVKPWGSYCSYCWLLLLALMGLIEKILQGHLAEQRTVGVDQGSAYSPLALNVLYSPTSGARSRRFSPTERGCGAAGEGLLRLLSPTTPPMFRVAWGAYTYIVVAVGADVR